MADGVRGRGMGMDKSLAHAYLTGWGHAARIVPMMRRSDVGAFRMARQLAMLRALSAKQTHDAASHQGAVDAYTEALGGEWPLRF
jgi:hypothetical protein